MAFDGPGESSDDPYLIIIMNALICCRNQVIPINSDCPVLSNRAGCTGGYKKMKKMVLAAALSVAMSGAFAQDSSFAVAPENMYGSIKYTMLDVDLNAAGLGFDTSPRAVSLGFGYKVNDYLAVEGLLGFGLDEDKISGTSGDFELDQMYGVSAVGYLPITDVVRLFAKVGFVQLDFDDSDGDKSDASGAMFGGGIEVGITKNLAFQIEYMELPDGEYDDYPIDVEGEMASMGLILQF